MKAQPRHLGTRRLYISVVCALAIAWSVGVLGASVVAAGPARALVLKMGPEAQHSTVLAHAKHLAGAKRSRTAVISHFPNREQSVQVPGAVMGRAVYIAQPAAQQNPATALFRTFLAVEASHSTNSQAVHVVLDKGLADHFGKRFLSTLFSALPVQSLTFVDSQGKATPARLAKEPVRHSHQGKVSGRGILLASDEHAALAKDLGRSLRIATRIGAEQTKRAIDPRGKEVYLLQAKPMTSDEAFHAELIHSLQTAYDSKRKGAGKVTMLAPYFAYSRSDRMDTARTTVGAAVLPQLVEAVGVDRMIYYSLHQAQEAGLFQALHLQGVHASGETLLADRMARELKAQGVDPKDLVVLGPDAGAVKRARVYAKRLAENFKLKEVPVGAGGDKERNGDKVTMRFNTDLKGKVALIVDDETASGTTLDLIAQATKDAGAVASYAAVSHLTGPAHQKLANAQALKQLFVLNTVPLPEAVYQSKKISVENIGAGLAKLIKGLDRAHSYKGISRLLFTEHE